MGHRRTDTNWWRGRWFGSAASPTRWERRRRKLHGQDEKRWRRKQARFQPQRNGSIYGRHFARFRLAPRDRKPRDEGRRDDLFVAMPPLEPKQASLAFLAGMREKRRWSHLEVRGRFHVTWKACVNPNKCDVNVKARRKVSKRRVHENGKKNEAWNMERECEWRIVFECVWVLL